MTQTDQVTVFEGIKSPYFSLRGNGQFGQVTRTGWKPTRLGEKKKAAILKALRASDTDSVYRVEKGIFKRMLNGKVERIA